MTVEPIYCDGRRHWAVQHGSIWRCSHCGKHLRLIDTTTSARWPA